MSKYYVVDYMHKDHKGKEVHVPLAAMYDSREEAYKAAKDYALSQYQASVSRGLHPTMPESEDEKMSIAFFDHGGDKTILVKPVEKMHTLEISYEVTKRCCYEVDIPDILAGDVESVEAYLEQQGKFDDFQTETLLDDGNVDTDYSIYDLTTDKQLVDWYD